MSDVAVNGVEARHSSATVEHYTPSYIVEAARTTLGGFDLDPFSCAKANETVRAEAFFSLDGGEDGFTWAWNGRVFCNPPGGRGDGNESNQKRAWFKLMAEHKAHHVDAAIFVCFSLELLQTTQVKPAGKLPLHFPTCYPSRRVAYTREDGTKGKSPPHASCLILVPDQLDHAKAVATIGRFREAFEPIGAVVIPC
jgi:hypothetical protein